MKVIFTSGPITARTPYQRFLYVRHAEEVMVRLLKEGWAVICPRKNTKNLDGAINRNLATEHQFWLRVDLAILHRCDAIFMLRGWERSRGSRMEYKKAKELKLEILYEED